MASTNDETRRRFLSFFSGVGLGGTLLPGVLWAQLQQDGAQRITQNTVQLEALVGPAGTVAEAAFVHAHVAQSSKGFFVGKSPTDRLDQSINLGLIIFRNLI